MTTTARLFRSLALLALAPLAGAQVWVVDSAGGPGSDFTDIQPAIDASGPGATIIVEAGSYSGFDLDLGLTIVVRGGNSSTLVSGPVTIQSVAGPHRATLSGLRITGPLTIQDATSTVLLDRLQVWGRTLITDSSDVRAIASLLNSAGSQVASTRLIDARLELINSTLSGGQGSDEWGCGGQAGTGDPGLVAEGLSELLAQASSIRGGNGGNGPEFCEWSQTNGGDGGRGVWLMPSSAAIIAGNPTHGVHGGNGGYGSCNLPPCFFDGSPGDAMRFEAGSFARYSGISVGFVSKDPGATVETPSPADPFVTQFGTHQAGRQLTFRVHGPPGADAILHLGRSPLIVPQAPSPVPQLTSRERSFLLGPIPPSGEAVFTFVVPQGAPIGFSFFAQAEVAIAPGDQRLTGSIPIVVRHDP